MDRKFKGIWIPKEVWLSEDLTLLEKVILVEIDSLEDEKEGCYASNKYFADFFKLTNGRISQIINSLNKKNYVTIEYKYNGKEIDKRVLRINRPPYPEVFNKLNRYLENYEGGIKYSKGGYLENYKDNNIINNNINNKKENIIKEKYFDNEEVNNIFVEFLEVRKKLKAVNSERAIKTLINKLNKYSDDIKFKMIERSVVNSWKDVYELKEEKREEVKLTQVSKGAFQL